MEPEDLDSPDSALFDEQLNALYQNLFSLISAQKLSIQQEKQKLQQEEKVFQQKKGDLEQAIQQAQSAISQQLCPKIDSKIVEFNVGGTHTLATTLSTLMKYPESVLSQLITSDHLQLYNNQVFIDRQGGTFSELVSFLRTGKFPIFSSPEHQTRFLDQLQYWGIPYQQPDIVLDEALRQFDPNWCASTLILQKNFTMLRKIASPHGIAFGANALSKHCPYIQFIITITSGLSTGSHIFLGVVDKSKYNSSQLVSTRWRDAPCSWYWDVWNSKLIRTDEYGVHSSVTGYGCGCDDDETCLGIYYDYKNRSLSFYKKGINQGVAFTNVSSGLFPSIDVWFDSGLVTITQNKEPRMSGFW